jgi:hypothetical protein
LINIFHYKKNTRILTFWKRSTLSVVTISRSLIQNLGFADLFHRAAMNPHQLFYRRPRGLSLSLHATLNHQNLGYDKKISRNLIFSGAAEGGTKLQKRQGN